MISRNRNIDVLILCGGLGKRLKAAVSDRPKSMALVAGRPFLDLLIDYIAGFGFRRIILGTGYKRGVIRAYFASRDGVDILFSEEKEALGTGGGIKNAKRLIKSRLFLAMNGDSFCDLDLNAFIKFHVRKKAIASIVITRAKRQKDCGVIRIDGSSRVLQFSEKERAKKHSYVNSGIYLFDKKIFSVMPKRRKFSLEKVLFPQFIGDAFYGFVTKKEFFDIGTPQRYARARRLLAKYARNKTSITER